LTLTCLSGLPGALDDEEEAILVDCGHCWGGCEATPAEAAMACV
jgi:hypothetical protein